MKQFAIWMLLAVLVSSVVLLVNYLFSAQPIQVILESGEEVVVQNNVFSITEVLVMVVSSFLIGLTSAVLYNISNVEEILRSIKKPNETKDYSHIFAFLKPDEKKVFEEIINSNGEILQNALVLNSNLSKVKVTRILTRLESRGLISKERHGLTNRIKIK